MPKHSKPYFGADPHRTSYKIAERLDCSTFKEFVDTQLNSPVRLSESFSVFWGLSEKAQKAAKAVKYFTPCAFGEDRSVKNNGNATSISLVCIDVDDNSDARQVLNNFPFIYEALAGLNFAIYTTCSHTEENPRCRIVVEAGGFETSLYKKAVSWVAGRLGLLSVTPESKTVSQAMYRPTVFSDTNVAEDHPVQAHETSLGALTVDMFADTEVMASQPRSGGQAPTLDTMDGLEYLAPKLDSVTLEDVKDALDATDPDIDMMSWVKIGMGMRHQFPDQDDEAFELFNEWSSKGEKYEDEEKTQKRWYHFAANTSDRIPVTIRTMLLIAKKAGWDNEAIQQKYYNDLVTYIESIQTFSGLVERALDKIAASPLLTPTLQESLLNFVVSTAKISFGQKLSVVSLKKSLRKKHSILRQAEIDQSQKDTPLPKWTRNLAFVSVTGKILRISTGEELDRDKFDSTYGSKLLPTKEQLESMGESDNAKIRNTPIMRPQDYVLNELLIPVAYDTTYDPRSADDAFVKNSGRTLVNTYQRTHPTPSEDKKAVAEAGRILKSHVAKLIKENEYQNMFLDFLAYNVQFPGNKVRWAPLIQGGEGCGKGLIARVMRAVMGKGHVKAVDPEKIFSAYNDWAYGAALVVLNEIHSKGMSRYEVENKLKEPIADDHVSINQKFRDHREIENVTNYVLFTNFQDALAISQSSRRYFVIKSPLQRKADIERLTRTGHFDEVFEMIDNQPRALRAWFEQYEISAEFNPEGPPPVTQYLKEMQEVTMPEAEQELEDILEEAEHALIQQDMISSTTLLTVLNSALTNPTSGKYVCKMLMDKGYTQAGRVAISGVRHRLWFGNNAEELQKLSIKELKDMAEDRIAMACGEFDELD